MVHGQKHFSKIFDIRKSTKSWDSSCLLSFINILSLVSKIIVKIYFVLLGAVNKESLENEVADVHRNIPWAQQAEKKSQLPG